MLLPLTLFRASPSAAAAEVLMLIGEHRGDDGAYCDDASTAAAAASAETEINTAPKARQG